MVTFRSTVLFMVLAAILSLGIACSGGEAPSKPGAVAKDDQAAEESKEAAPVAASQEKEPAEEPKQAAKEEPPAAEPKTLALTGTVTQDGDKMVLSTDLGDYVISGQDMSEMVGKIVNVTGAVEEVDGKATINVITFSQD